MNCAVCNLAKATSETDVGGVVYELCDECAIRFDHPSYFAKPELRAHQLAEMSRRHQHTEELTSHL